MNPSEVNFTFAGKHCLRDFGCVFTERDGRRIAPGAARSLYKIGGASGSLLLPGPGPLGATRTEMELPGTLSLVREPKSQREAQARLREIASWLIREENARLIFDYEPERFYLARVDDAPQWSLASWFGGQVAVTFILQPLAYNLHADAARAAWAGETGAVTLALTPHTGLPAPIRADILNTGATGAAGTATITGVEISSNGALVSFSGLSLLPGQTLAVRMETPVGAEILSADGKTLASALPYMEAFRLIALGRGAQRVNVRLTAAGSGTKGAEISVRVRGRW